MAEKAIPGAGSDQEEINQRDQGGSDAGGDQDIVRLDIAMWIERWLVHSRGQSQFRADATVLGQGNRIVCEAAHIRQDSLRAVPGNGFPTSGLVSKQGLAIRIREGQVMALRPQSWSSGDAERRWLSALIDAMERVSRREVRAVPCDRVLLAAVKVQLARPVPPYSTWQDPNRRACRAPDPWLWN